jgi:hypothetical protein
MCTAPGAVSTLVISQCGNSTAISCALEAQTGDQTRDRGRSKDEDVPAPITRADIEDLRPRAIRAGPEDLLDRANVVSVYEGLEEDVLHLVSPGLDVVDGIGEREVFVEGVVATVCFSKVL